MPAHFFPRCLRLDYQSAAKANTAQQNFSTAPRYWYIDASAPCEHCGSVFRFTADEQRVWYEEYGFYVDSFPKRCPACRHDQRRYKALQQEYDCNITAALGSADVELKLRLISIIDVLSESGKKLPGKMHENRSRLANQLAHSH
jgi:hypothetical protein